MSPEVAIIVVSVVIAGVLINLVLLGFMLKLYTKIFKEKAFSNRAKGPGPAVRELLRGPYSSTDVAMLRAHAGNVREMAKLLPIDVDKQCLLNAAFVFDEVIGYIRSTTA